MQSCDHAFLLAHSPCCDRLWGQMSGARAWMKGEGSHADRLERIIARAHQADKLEAQLARECEKRQRLELELKRLQQAQGKPAEKPATETKLSPLSPPMSLPALTGAMFLMLS